MTTKLKLIIYEEQTFKVGDDLFIDSTTENSYAVVFEDNGETGYFYAVDSKNMKVLDGVCISTMSPTWLTNTSLLL
mgnify:CR=1 FL=1